MWRRRCNLSSKILSKPARDLIRFYNGLKSKCEKKKICTEGFFVPVNDRNE